MKVILLLTRVTIKCIRSQLNKKNLMEYTKNFSQFIHLIQSFRKFKVQFKVKPK